MSGGSRVRYSGSTRAVIFVATATARRTERGLAIAVIFMAVATVPAVILEEQGQTSLGLDLANWSIWTVFALDYAILLLLATDRRTYVRRNWLGAAIVLLSFPLTPPLFALVRLARLSRLLRLLRIGLVAGRALGGLRLVLGRPGLLYVASVSAIIVIAGGGMLTILEPETVKGDFWTGVWWALVTTTTVGYGDITPSTPEGRILAAVLMVSGLGFISTLSATIAAYFVRHDAEREDAEMKVMKKQLDEMREMLRQLTITMRPPI